MRDVLVYDLSIEDAAVRVFASQAGTFCMVGSRHANPGCFYRVTPGECSCPWATMGGEKRTGDSCWHKALVRKYWGKWPIPDSQQPIVTRLIGLDEEEVELEVDQQGDAISEGWVDIKQVLGTRMIPAVVAAVVKKGIDRMVRRDEVSANARFLALEYWAADYMAGGGG